MFQAEQAIKPRPFRDERTGREVLQVTPDGCANLSNYFYLNCFSRDERFFYYSSDRSGDFQVHRLCLETGESWRLTDVAGGVHFRWNLHPSGGELFYTDGRKIKALNLDSTNVRVVFDAADHAWMKSAGPEGPIRFSGDGQWLSFIFVHDPQDCISPNIWSHSGLITYQRMGAVRVACDGLAAECVYLHHEAMQHLMFCPADNDQMTFAVYPDYQNNETLMNNHRARAWLIDRKRDMAHPYLIMPKGYRATHEYWSPCSQRFFYHKRRVDGIRSPSRWFPCFIGYMERATGRQVDFFRSDTQHLGHSICTPDARFIVSDNDIWAARATRGADNELLLIEVETGEAQALWWPNVRGTHPKMSCGGPCMSPKGTWVGHSSDRTGEPQVYLTRLPSSGGST